MVVYKMSFDIYKDWIEIFIGKVPNIKSYNGNKWYNRLLGRSNSYASFAEPREIFSYNYALMDKLDEARIIAIAAHEAGHYWTLKRKFKLRIITQLFIIAIIIFKLYLCILLIMIVMAILLKDTNAEYNAEEFVRKTIGPAMSLNSIMNIVCDAREEIGVVKWRKGDLIDIKEALKELNIKYEAIHAEEDY
jgi:hypothetical protein